MIEEIESHAGSPACGCHASESKTKQPVAESRMSTSPIESLSQEDLARVAARIAELMGGNAFAGGACNCTCCGPNCAGRCAERDPATMRGLKDMGAGRIGHSLGGRTDRGRRRFADRPHPAQARGNQCAGPPTLQRGNGVWFRLCLY